MKKIRLQHLLILLLAFALLAFTGNALASEGGTDSPSPEETPAPPKDVTITIQSKKEITYGDSVDPSSLISITGAEDDGFTPVYTVLIGGSAISNPIPASEQPYNITVNAEASQGDGKYNVKVEGSGTLTVKKLDATPTISVQDYTYNGKTPDVTVSWDKDLATSELGTTFLTTFSENPESAGEHTVTVTIDGNNNINVSNGPTFTATYHVLQRSVTPLIVGPKDVQYGSSDPMPVVEWDIKEEYVKKEIGDPVIETSSVDSVESVNGEPRNMSVTVMDKSNNNVKISTTEATATYNVIPRTVKLTINPASRTYDGTAITVTDPTLTYSWDDTKAADELTVTLKCEVGANRGEYEIIPTITGNTQNFSDNSGVRGVYTVDPLKVTFTVNSQTKVYDGTPNLPEEPSGKWSNDLASGLQVTYGYNNQNANKGTYDIPATVEENSNFDVTVVPGKFEITPAGGVTLTLTAPSPREYNGKVPTKDEIKAAWTNQPEGLDYELYFVDDPKADVGSYTVSANITGANKDNYTVTVTNAEYVINPLKVTLKMPDDHKTYDGKEADVSKLKGEWSSDLAKDIVYTPTVEKTKNAGSYAIGATVTENKNFTVTVTPGTYTINPKPATITPNEKTKTYGDPDPAFDATVTGVLAGEKLNYTLGRDVKSENVGKYSIKVTYDKTDAVNRNYEITTSSKNLNIVQRPVTLTVEDKPKVYGDKDPEFTVTTDNMAKGETLAYTISRKDGEKVGTYTIDATLDENAAVNKNYKITVKSGTLTISKRPVTLTAATLSKIYGDKDPTLTASADNMAFTDQLQYTVKRVAGENVGDYDITIELPKTAVEPNNNYTITTKAAKLTIKQRPVKLTAEAKTKVYGDKDPELTATTDNMANGEKLVYTLSRTEGEKVGTYTITVTPDAEAAVNKNYAITPVTGVLTVTKRPVTLTATALSKIYGEKDPTLTATPDNMAFTDKLAYTLKRAEGENVGDYAITIELPKAATEPNNNYDIKLVAAKLTINQRPVKLTAEAKTKIYGEKDPEFTATTDNMVNDEKLVYTLSRTEGEKVGKYTITATPDAEAAVNKNYAITPVANTLTIDPLAIKLTVAESAKFYGQKDPTFTASAPTVYDDVLQYTFERDEGEAVGAYEVRVVPTADVEPNSNYTITPVAAKLTVSYLPHADAVISAPDENGWYNVKSGPITITAPEGYEISKTYDEGFGPSIVFEDSKVLETAKYTYVLRSVKTDGTADGQTEIVTGEYRQDTVPPTEFTVNNSSSVRFVPADNENGSGIVRSEYVQFKSSSEEVVDGRVLYQSTNLDEVRFQHPYAGGFRVVQWDAAGNCTVSNYITLPDSDGDRLNDYFEQDFKSDPKKQDTDGDGLNDSEEYTRGCNPNSSDSDGDGLTDGEEVSKGLNPTRTDTDSDGIPDGTAYLYEGKDADLSMGAEMVLGRGYSTETAVTTAKVPEVLEQYAMYGFIEEHASAELTGAQATRSVGNKVKPVVYMNRASGHVITLTGDILSVYVQNNYRFNAETTLQLNYLAEGETATALVSNDGQVAAIAKWENGVAAEDILLVDIAAGKTYLVSDSAGATLFDLRADGTELAYVKDGQLTTLTLGKEDDMHVQAYSGNALQYLEDGSLAVNINVESWKADVLANGQMKTVDFSGYYYLGNRALGSVQLIMRAEGQNVEIEMSGNVVLSSQDTLIRFVNSEQKYKALITANQFTK